MTEEKIVNMMHARGRQSMSYETKFHSKRLSARRYCVISNPIQSFFCGYCCIHTIRGSCNCTHIRIEAKAANDDDDDEGRVEETQ